MPFDEVRDQIVEVASGLHSVGTFSPRTLRAIADAAGKREIRHSAETGSGASTLLFSHLSRQHTVFALDDGNGSIESVRRSQLLCADRVTFVEGPSQITLPKHRFAEKLQLVLIDGPHAYPFPDLEYYYFYPHLETGALLIVDDIQIPTVHNLYRFLRRDAMFELEQVVEKTAFFRRTNAVTFDPLGDGWWNQKYNARPLRRYGWREKMRRLSAGLARKRGERMVQILSPAEGATVGDSGVVEGLATLAPDSYLWILARRKNFDGWWPQGAGAVAVVEDRWSVTVNYGGPQDDGAQFELAAVVVRRPTHELWMGWVKRVSETGQFPPVRLPRAEFVLGKAFRIVRKKLKDPI